MGDETLSRVQAKCEHDWQYAPGLGRQCHKCSLPWEVWAERRLASLEERITFELEDDDEDEGEDESEYGSIAFGIVTLLPPQNEYTCAHCNGMGQRAFFDYTIVCQACSTTYDLDDVAHIKVDEALPCGHLAKSAIATTDCIACHGTGINLACGA